MRKLKLGGYIMFPKLQMNIGTAFKPIYYHPEKKELWKAKDCDFQKGHCDKHCQVKLKLESLIRINV